MTPERWAKIRQTFEAALDRPVKDRVAFLHFSCGADEDLRVQVEELLKSHNDSTDFLSTPVVQLGQFLASSTLLSETMSEATLATPGGISGSGFPGKSLADSWDRLQGYCVGPYQFERCIGRGGMGSVWLATRSDHEFRKKVAVKVVRHGMDSHEILRRFKLERQVLANLEHPNIARLIDGGSTADGMPFLVMEYVEGIPIDRYCEQNQLPVNARLELFRAVCSSVQYAHQNLIVHRDIKANNILVNADGIPKLLDFGIAKLLRAETTTLSSLSVDLSQTLPHLRPMTLDYASPEQVRGDPIATTTDVYSLGVLLYKLLSGRMPHQTESKSFATMQHAIRETDPLRPSDAALIEDDTAIPIATQSVPLKETGKGDGQVKARRRLRTKLAGDLDSIVLKALQKNPQERYASAEQLSEDIRRYLEGLPVRARMGTPGYRLGKLIRRNRTLVAAAAIVLIAMLVTTIGSYRYARSASRADSNIQSQTVTMRRKLMHAQNDLGVAKRSAGDFNVAYSAFIGALETAQELWILESSLNGQPSADTRQVLADANASLGRVLQDSGATQGALEKFNRARDYYQQIVSLEPGNENARRSLQAIDQMLNAAAPGASGTSLPKRIPIPQKALPSFSSMNPAATDASGKQETPDTNATAPVLNPVIRPVPNGAAQAAGSSSSATPQPN